MCLNQKIDAAVNYHNQQILFFQGSFYQSMDIKTGQLSGQWKPWPGLPANWNNQLDAIVNWAQNTFVFFKGLEFSIYDASKEQYVQQGNVSTWQGWPAHWNDGFNATLNIDGIIYFFRGGEIIAFNQQTKKFTSASPVTAVFPNSVGSGSSTVSMPISVSENNASETNEKDHPFMGSEEKEATKTLYKYTYDPKVHGRFRTDYEDFEDGYREEKSFIGNAGNLKIPGYNWLGAGIDITRYNPIFPVRSWRGQSPVVSTLSSKTGGNNGSSLLPWGCEDIPRSSGKGSIRSQWIKSYRDFVQTFKVGGEAKIGIGKTGQRIAGADFSGSFTEMIQKKIGSEAIYHVQKIHSSIYNLTMNLTWLDRELGQCRQRMSPSFEDDIKKLPANPSMEECNKIIERYGTHIAVGLRMGGIHLVLTEVEKSHFEDSKMTEQQFKAKASGSIKKVSVGASVEFSNSEQLTEGGSTSTFERQTDIIGGEAIQDKNIWATKLKEDPVPTSISMVPLWDILNDKFFFGDTKINSKKLAMRKAIQEYIKKNTFCS